MYEGLPIATNKLSIEERKSIPHHLLDCIGLKEKPWDVGSFKQNAVKIVNEIRSRGRLPILVGGTHYYTQALLFKDAILDDANPRHGKGVSLEQRWPILGSSTENIMEELKRVDPVMAARWHPQDRRKIRRSLEIYLTTGITASETYARKRERKFSGDGLITSKQSDGNEASIDQADRVELEMKSRVFLDPLILWVHADSDILQKRLDKRIDDMIERGLLSEAKSTHTYLQELESEGIVIDQSCGIWAAIGFKELKPYLEMYNLNPTNDKALENLKQEGIECIRNATRQYAKYQARWIRLNMQEAIYDNKLDTSFFLLDGTNLTHWFQDVDSLAIKLTQMFLRGERLPSPESLSTAAKQLLMACEKQDYYARHCDLCDKTMMSNDEWDKHVKGKKHKRALKPKIDWRALYPKETAQ